MDNHTAAEIIAGSFHRTYEELAPEHGYRTREASAVPWSQVPEPNRKLMVATVERLLDAGVIRPAAPDPDAEAVVGRPLPTPRGWGLG